MWDEVEMPDRACRLASLVRYSRAKYPWMNSGETITAAEAVADATPEYSMRGYCTFGEKEERAALYAVFRARHAVIETVMMCLARQQQDLPSGQRKSDQKSSCPISAGPSSAGPSVLAGELRSIPSQIMAIIASAAMRV